MARTPPRLHRADELLEPPYRDLDCELWDGALMVHEPHGGYAGHVSSLLSERVGAHVRPRHLGWMGDCGTGYLLRTNPDRLLVPDMSFLSRERLAALPARGFARAVPDLVAEVRSPRDPWSAVLLKGGTWIAHGVRVVWLVDPLERTVTTLRPGAAPEFASPSGSISAAPALPDLTIPVADLFQDLP